MSAIAIGEHACISAGADGGRTRVEGVASDVISGFDSNEHAREEERSERKEKKKKKVKK